jgi:hypothetical protein
MAMPSYTAGLALYRSPNIYREPGVIAGMVLDVMSLDDLSRAEAASTPTIRTSQGKTLCNFIIDGVIVNECPVIDVPCNPPHCNEGEVCCFSRTEHTDDATYNYYTCVNLQTDPHNCGQCRKSCPQGSVCCNGVCVDATAPNYDCTECGCAGGMICQSGSCQCPSGKTNCGGYCTNTSTDWSNCGTCGNVCPDLGNTYCQDGHCQCMSYGDIICNDSCTNPYGDSSNCGACGNVCPPGTCCSGGVCVATDVQNDPNNCGSCGNQCYSFNCCSNGKCANTLTDIHNCGTCGNVCPHGYSCCNGNCVDYHNDPNNCGGCYAACSSGQICCNGKCVDPYLDSQNCGGCGTVCRNGCCAGGSCANFSNDPYNCGSCGNFCLLPLNNCFNGCCVDGAPALVSNNQSNTNYWMVNQNVCDNIQGPAVSMQISPQQAMFSPNGFSLQLNVVPPPNNVGVTWMQYAFNVTGNGVNGIVEYWGNLTNQTTPGGCIAFSNQDLNVGCCSFGSCCSGWDSFWDPVFGGQCQQSIPFLSIPNNTLPAGYFMLIYLDTDPTTDNVTEADFYIFTPNNTFTSFGVPIPGNLQVPAQALQFVAVGLNGGATASFSPGAGTMSYGVSSGQLCVAGATVPCPSAAIYSGFTGETSNASYGTMNTCCSSSLKQSVTL